METSLCPLCYYRDLYSRKQASCHLNPDNNPHRCLKCGEDIQDGNTYIVSITKLLDGEIWRNEKFCEPEIQAYCMRRIACLGAVKEHIIPLFQDKTRDEVITIMATMP